MRKTCTSNDRDLEQGILVRATQHPSVSTLDPTS